MARREGPDWVRHAIWWHVYPLGFVGAEPALADPRQPVVHRLAQLHDWLDHLLALGASGLALGPVFESETHGYDTTDHFRIDPRLGDEQDLGALIKAAADRGVRVLLDGVFHHVGRGHPAVREGRPWFRRDGDSFATFEGHDALVALDHSRPEVADLVAGVMNHWLDRGVAGWRLDAAYAVPVAFWAEVTARVRARHPDAYLMGEVIHGDYAEFVTAGQLDAVTQYELWKAIWSSLNDGNFHELAYALGRHDAFLDTFVPYTFLGNHDVTRIASRLHDPAHLPHALTVLMTVAGTPAVYAGDEHAFTGVKEDRAGGDDAVRPPFPATPAGLSPLGLPTFHRHQELISLRRRHPWLHTARFTALEVGNDRLSYASAADEGRIVVALSTASTPVTLPAPGVTAVLAGQGDLDGDRVTLPPGGWAVLS